MPRGPDIWDRIFLHKSLLIGVSDKKNPEVLKKIGLLGMILLFFDTP